MGFWIYMFLMTLLIPAVMLVFGYRYRKGGPKKINRLFGYRTPRAMKTRETWDFAHRSCGTYWSWIGWPALTAAITYMPIVRNRDVDTIAFAATTLILLQLAAMCLVIVPTERALKREFDENGNRIG